MLNTEKYITIETNKYKKKIFLKKFIEDNSASLKLEYLEINKNIENHKISKKKIFDYFNLKRGHNLWEMSLFKEKSNLKSDQIYNSIKFLAIFKIVKSYKPRIISFHNISVDNIIKEFLKEKKIVVRFYPGQENLTTINYFKITIKVLTLNLKNIIEKLFFQFPKKQKKISDSNVTIFGYFAHYKLKNNSYYFNQYGEIINYLKKFYKVDNKLIFVPSEKIKNIHSNIIKKNNLDFLNHDLSIYNKINIFFLYYRYCLKFFLLKFKFIKNFKGKNNYIFRIHISDYYKSFCGDVLLENLIWINIFDNYLSKGTKKKFCIYLIENQPWEKAMINSWRYYNHGKIFAYTPTSINFWHMYNFDLTKNKNFNPDNLLVSSHHGYKLLKKQTKIKNIKIFQVESLWFNYLYKNIVSDNSNNSILILGDYDTAKNFKLLKIIFSSKLVKRREIFFKKHPHDILNYDDYNLKIVNKNIIDLIPIFNFIVSSSSTSAIIEFLRYRKKIFVFDDEDDLDLSPLKKLNYPLMFKNLYEFNKLLKKKNISKFITKNFKNYYFVDKNLKKWKTLLKN